MKKPENHGVTRVRRLAWVTAIVLAWACGCSQSELARKDEKIKTLSESWQQSEAARVALRDEKTCLAETLKARESALAAVSQAYKKTAAELERRTAEAAERADALARAEDKSYDLEMSYETLCERINELKRDLEERNGRIGALKQAGAELENARRVDAEKAARTLADQTAQTAAAQAETDRMRSLAESLEAERVKLRARNAQLEREAVQIPDLKAQIAALANAKASLEAQLAKAGEDVEMLHRRAAGIKAAAEAAGTNLAVADSAFSDWEVLKRMAANRWERARKGSFAGDTVDWVIVGVCGAVLFMFTLSFAALVIAGRRGRRVARFAVEDSPTKVINRGFAEDAIEDAIEDDLALSDGPAEEDLQPAPRATLDEAAEEESAAESFLNAPAHELHAVAAAPRGAPAPAPAGGRTRPAPASPPACQLKDDALIGELRDVINKKFDELLKG